MSSYCEEQAMNYTLLHGDALEVLRNIPNESIQTCVTSPPYYGLRDYGIDGQIGIEETPEKYIDRLIDIFREVKRVLHNDGILWINIGDSYYHTTSNNGGYSDKSTLQGFSNPNTKGRVANDTGKHIHLNMSGIKPKEIIGIPWALAFALRTDGWYLRQDIVWAKSNPMPESVKDRCTRSHEYIFMLTKNKKYYFNREAIQEPAVQDNSNTRNKRDVWYESVGSYKGAHFAVFPEKLIEPCILAGSREGDTVLDPFSGSGTTGVVSIRNRRNYIGIDLSASYNAMATKRLEAL